MKGGQAGREELKEAAIKAGRAGKDQIPYTEHTRVEMAWVCAHTSECIPEWDGTDERRLCEEFCAGALSGAVPLKIPPKFNCDTC